MIKCSLEALCLKKFNDCIPVSAQCIFGIYQIHQIHLSSKVYLISCFLKDMHYLLISKRVQTNFYCASNGKSKKSCKTRIVEVSGVTCTAFSFSLGKEK